LDTSRRECSLSFRANATAQSKKYRGKLPPKHEDVSTIACSETGTKNCGGAPSSPGAPGSPQNTMDVVSWRRAKAGAKEIGRL